MHFVLAHHCAAFVRIIHEKSPATFYRCLAVSPTDRPLLVCGHMVKFLSQ